MTLERLCSPTAQVSTTTETKDRKRSLPICCNRPVVSCDDIVPREVVQAIYDYFVIFYVCISHSKRMVCQGLMNGIEAGFDARRGYLDPVQGFSYARNEFAVKWTYSGSES